MQSVQDQAQGGVRAVQEGAQRVIDQIPPDAWPFIDLMFQITISLTLIWLVLELIGWWRRRAYNLTVAGTASQNKKAQPDFLKVDEKARKEQIARGERHEEMLDAREREEALAALKAAKGPVSIASRIASMATLLMSLFTLLSGLSGAVFSVGRMSSYLEEAGTTGRLEYVLTEHTFGCVVAVFVIGYNIWRYFSEKKWKKA
ncbi:MAG: hypothetical protein ABJP48_03460 [Erythrobacter sp.]